MPTNFSFGAWISSPAVPTPPPPVIVGPPGPPGVPGSPGVPGVPGVPGQNALGRQIEIDFGPVPVPEAEFTIVDAEVTPASVISGSLAYVAPTGKTLDELQMDSLAFVFGAGSGSFKIFARGLLGDVAGAFKLNYLIS